MGVAARDRLRPQESGAHWRATGARPADRRRDRAGDDACGSHRTETGRSQRGDAVGARGDDPRRRDAFLRSAGPASPAGYDIAEAARRIGVTTERLELAEAGEHLLTMRQAEVAARLYDRPSPLRLSGWSLLGPPAEAPGLARGSRVPPS